MSGVAISVLVGAFLISACAERAMVRLSFDDIAPGVRSPFPVEDAEAGIKAIIGSPDNGAYGIIPSYFRTFSGNILQDNDPEPHSLLIQFNKEMKKVRLRFGVNQEKNAVLHLRAFRGKDRRLVGEASAQGKRIGDGPILEGSISFKGRFDSIELTSSGQDFAISAFEVLAAK